MGLSRVLKNPRNLLDTVILVIIQKAERLKSIDGNLRWYRITESVLDNGLVVLNQDGLGEEFPGIRYQNQRFLVIY